VAGLILLALPVLAASSAGKGRWLTRLPAQLVEPANAESGAIPVLPSSYEWLPDRLLVQPDILVYADDYFHPAPATYVDRALQYLALPYLAFYGGNYAGFENALATGGPWSLVIFASENSGAPSSTRAALNAYVLGGGNLIAEDWYMGLDAGHALWTTLGVTWVGDDPSAAPISWWFPGHPFFITPFPAVPQFTARTNPGYGIIGQYVQPLGSFGPTGGYTATVCQQGHSALVIGNDGRTVFKGFLDGGNDADLNSNGVPDAQELWVNMISCLSAGSCPVPECEWGPAYDVTFFDDYGRSELCLNSSTGDYRYTVLKGTYAGQVFTGTAAITHYTPTYFLFGAPCNASSSHCLSGNWNTSRHAAAASLRSYTPRRFGSTLSDGNYLNSPPCGGP
jgi:hypothetical protein